MIVHETEIRQNGTRYSEGFFASCDGCGKTGDVLERFAEAACQAETMGWIWCGSGLLCRACQEAALQPDPDVAYELMKKVSDDECL